MVYLYTVKYYPVIKGWNLNFAINVVGLWVIRWSEISQDGEKQILWFHSYMICKRKQNKWTKQTAQKEILSDKNIIIDSEGNGVREGEMGKKVNIIETDGN